MMIDQNFKDLKLDIKELMIEIRRQKRGKKAGGSGEEYDSEE